MLLIEAHINFTMYHIKIPL